MPSVFAANEQAHLTRPSTALIGKDSSGCYRTAAAKEYPEGMNLSLALTFKECILRRSLAPAAEVSFHPLGLELAMTSACVDRSRQLMPDYQPRTN